MARGNDENILPSATRSQEDVSTVSGEIKGNVSGYIDKLLTSNDIGRIKDSKSGRAGFPWSAPEKTLREKLDGIIDVVRAKAPGLRKKLLSEAKEEVEEIKDDPKRILPIVLPTFAQQILTFAPLLLTGLRPGAIAAIATAKFALRVYSTLKTGALVHKGIKALYKIRQSFKSKKDLFQATYLSNTFVEYNKLTSEQKLIFQKTLNKKSRLGKS